MFSVIGLRSVALAAVIVLSAAGGAGAVGSEQAATVAACRIQAQNLTLRSGPGASFAPVGSLLQGAQFRGVSFVKTGIPNGSWVEAELTPGVSAGFLPADTQSVRCTPAPTALQNPTSALARSVWAARCAVH